MAITSITPRDLARQTDDELLEAYHLDRDPAAREQLVKQDAN